MAFCWKKVSLFGFMLAIPVVVFIIKKREEHVNALTQHHKVVAECAKCHKLLNAVAGVRLIMHLQKDHGIEEDKAIRIVEDVYKKIFISRGEK